MISYTNESKFILRIFECFLQGYFCMKYTIHYIDVMDSSHKWIQLIKYNLFNFAMSNVCRTVGKCDSQ